MGLRGKRGKSVARLHRNRTNVRTCFLRVVVRDIVADGSFKFLSMSDFLFCVEVFLEDDRCLVGRLEERRSSVAWFCPRMAN